MLQPRAVKLSLSRFNHGLPGCKTHPAVMQGPAQCHHALTDALLPQTDPVFHHATTLHAPVDMLDAEPALVQGLVGACLLPRQFLAAGFLGRHEELDLGQRQRQEAQILPQPASRGQGRGRRGGHRLVMEAAAAGLAEEEENEQGIPEQDIFDGVVLLLAALTRGLFRRVLGADAPPLRPVMGKRGEAGAAAGTATTGVGSSSSGATTGAASASETPSRCAKAVRERAGASPRARSAASSAGRRTWIH
jgi:hypothetical protein